MKRFMYFIFFLFLSCSNYNDNTNILNTYIGMKDDELLKCFGNPYHIQHFEDAKTKEISWIYIYYNFQSYNLIIYNSSYPEGFIFLHYNEKIEFYIQDQYVVSWLKKNNGD